MGEVHKSVLCIMHLDLEEFLLFVFTCHLQLYFQIKQSVRSVLHYSLQKKKCPSVSPCQDTSNQHREIQTTVSLDPFDLIPFRSSHSSTVQNSTRINLQVTPS